MAVTFLKMDLKKAWWSVYHVILTVLLWALSTSCRGCGLSHIFFSSVNSLINGVRIKCNSLNWFLWSMGMILQTHCAPQSQLFGSLLFVDFIFLVHINHVSCKSSKFLYFIFVHLEPIFSTFQLFCRFIYTKLFFLLMQDIFTELSGTFFPWYISEVLHCPCAVFYS
jgi:hypothetical protein